MSIQLSVPSKTFLVGEYAVLRGGPSLLLSTAPRFTMTAQMGQTFTSPFHTQSPAGRYFHENAELNQWQMQFDDPHEAQGGFGASSAQLLMLMAVHRQIKNADKDKNKHAERLLNDFYDLGARNGFKSSGADMMAQIAGGVVYFQRDPFALTSGQWQMDGLDFILIRTGFKVPTHWHVRDLGEFPVDLISTLVNETHSALERGSVRDVVRGVREYRTWLQAQKFETERTTDLLAELERTGLTLTAKGCGAMGADVVLALVETGRRHKLIKWAADHRLHVVATSDDLSGGLQIAEAP